MIHDDDPQHGARGTPPHRGCVAPVRYTVTGRVACIYLPLHGHVNDIADALPRLTNRRRPAFYRLSPRSNDLEVIRSPSNVRSNSSEQRHVNIVAALTVGLRARQPQARRKLVHHPASTPHRPRSPIAIGVTAILVRSNALAMHIFWGATILFVRSMMYVSGLLLLDESSLLEAACGPREHEFSGAIKVRSGSPTLQPSLS